MSDATRAKFVYGMGEAQVAFGRMAERVAELERTLADVTRERDELREGAAEEMRQRDTYRDMWQAAESRLADAERRGAREGERRGAWAMWERIREGGTLSRDDANEWIWNRYPAVPPEREGARTGRKIVGAADDSASATDFVVTTPPQAAPEPLEIRVTDIGPVFQHLVVRITPEDARAIVALASRPTASGEG